MYLGIDVGEKVKKIRVKCGWKLEALANEICLRGKVKMTESRLSKIERGQVNSRLFTLFAIADVLGCPPLKFFMGTERTYIALKTYLSTLRNLDRPLDFELEDALNSLYESLLKSITLDDIENEYEKLK